MQQKAKFFRGGRSYLKPDKNGQKQGKNSAKTGKKPGKNRIR